MKKLTHKVFSITISCKTTYILIITSFGNTVTHKTDVTTRSKLKLSYPSKLIFIRWTINRKETLFCTIKFMFYIKIYVLLSTTFFNTTGNVNVEADLNVHTRINFYWKIILYIDIYIFLE